MDGAKIDTASDSARNFITAGKAVFTVKSMKSGVHFTYRVEKKTGARDGAPIYFVSVLGGEREANERYAREFEKHAYQYLCILDTVRGVPRLSSASPIGWKATPTGNMKVD